MQIKTITKAEFHALFRRVSPLAKMLKKEIGWFQHSETLGVVVEDNVDHDYGFVVVRKTPDGDYAPAEFGDEFRTVGEARDALEKRMARAS